MNLEVNLHLARRSTTVHVGRVFHETVHVGFLHLRVLRSLLTLALHLGVDVQARTHGFAIVSAHSERLIQDLFVLYVHCSGVDG